MTHYWLRIRQNYIKVVILFCMSMTIFSCKENDNQLGENLLPDNASLNTILVDTMSATAFTVVEDSIKTDSLSRGLIGAMNDPIFGTSEIGLGFEILLPEINLNFGSAPTLDSVVLMLKIETDVTTYGNVNTRLDLDVFQLEEEIDAARSYYSNYVPTLGSQVASWTGSIDPADTTKYTDLGVLRSELATIRIPLSEAFGNSLINAPAGVYGSNIAFLDYMNGLYLKGNVAGKASGEGGAAAIDLDNAETKLIIYYNGDSKKDLIITSESERYQTYTVNNQGTDIPNQLSNGNRHYEKTYMQSMGGSKTRILIPALLDLAKEGNVLINEASITFKVDESTITEDYPAPGRLLLFQPKESDGANGFIEDLLDVILPTSQAWIGYTNYGGTYDEVNKTYTFRFNRHLQKLLDDCLETGEDNNRGFLVTIPSDFPITPSRLVLDHGAQGAASNLKVKIIYTKL